MLAKNFVLDSISWCILWFTRFNSLSRAFRSFMSVQVPYQDARPRLRMSDSTLTSLTRNQRNSPPLDLSLSSVVYETLPFSSSSTLTTPSLTRLSSEARLHSPRDLLYPEATSSAGWTVRFDESLPLLLSPDAGCIGIFLDSSGEISPHF